MTVCCSIWRVAVKIYRLFDKDLKAWWESVSRLPSLREVVLVVENMSSLSARLHELRQFVDCPPVHVRAAYETIGYKYIVIDPDSLEPTGEFYRSRTVHAF